MGKRVGGVTLWRRLAPRVLAIGLSGLSAWAVAAEVVLSERAFQDRVVEAVGKRHPKAKVVRLGSGQLRVTMPGQEPVTSSLERAYLLYAATPSELEVIVGNIASSMDSHSRPIRAENLIVLVRPAAYFAQMSKVPDGVLVRPLVGDMAAVVALDEPDSYALKPASDLRPALKLDDDGLWTRAMANTLPQVDFERHSVPDGRIIEISTGKGVASSLLVHEAFWNDPALTQHGPVVVFAFTRDTLLITRLSDAVSVARLRKLAEGVRDDPNGLTNEVIVRRDGRWEVLR